MAAKEGGRAAEAHDQLIGAVVRLTAHDYTDVRSACSEAIEWCWFYYAWALKPRLAPALREISGEPGALFAYKYEGPRPAAKRSSELFAAVAFAAPPIVVVRLGCSVMTAPAADPWPC